MEGKREMSVSRWQLALLVLLSMFGSAALGAQAPDASAASVGFEFKGAFGPDGTDASEFGNGGSVAVDQVDEVAYVLDQEAGALFKFDLEGNPVPFGGASPNISGNEMSGLSIGGTLPEERQVAVDSMSHIIYLTGAEAEEKAKTIQAFHSNGEPAPFTAGPGAGTNEIPGLFDAEGVAVDSNGNIYVGGVDEGSSGLNINVYRPDGSLLLEKAGGNNNIVANLAVDGKGTLYAVLNTVVHRYMPSEYPITPDTTYTLAPDPVDVNPAASVAVDPLTNRVYVLESYRDNTETDVSKVAVFSEEGVLEGTFGGPGEPGELDRGSGIAVGNIQQVGVEGVIAQPLVAQNPTSGPSQVMRFQEEVCICQPSIDRTWATGVTGDSATLRAEINPNNLETNYWFEYGPGDCALVVCSQVPLDPQSIGDGRRGVKVSQSIADLEAKTTYHFRVVAENELGVTDGPYMIFTTQTSGIGTTLSDQRIWEMVSPAKKFGGLVSSADVTLIQASIAGDSLAYASIGPIVKEPTSNRLIDFATVLAKRGSDGRWSSDDLTPTHTEATKVAYATPFKIFSPDLLRAGMDPTDATPLSSAASEQTPYLWADGSPPLFTPLVDPANVPPGTEFGPQIGGSAFPIRVEGASPDLEHVVVRSEVTPLVEGAGGNSIYMWSDGTLEAVSELPEGEGGGVVEASLGSGQGSVRHAVSANGTRVFWAPTLAYNAAGIGLPALYMRDTVADRSVRLDVVRSGAGAGLPRPAFNSASVDGRVVFFTDSQQLTEDASPSGRDLYRCEIGNVEGDLGCVELTDISAPSEGSGESANVLDQVSGISDDGTRLYFVARGALDEAPNQEGEVASPGEPNLYYWQEGQGSKFIATLSESDYYVWGGFVKVQGYAIRISAAASPSGRYFTFTSDRSLTGYENKNDAGGSIAEVFAYDSDAGALTCVSCHPSGAGAVGERIPAKGGTIPPDPAELWVDKWVAATVPEASVTAPLGNSLYRPRSVLDNGRVFFNAVDRLVPADSNGNWDVYQYEPLGVGSCAENTSDAMASRLGDGCIGLLSSGTAASDAGFLDSSASGNDAFFLTRGRLSVLDIDDEYDAYDARVDGIRAVLEPIRDCVGEACQPASSPPNDPTPASESFRGAGTPIKCRKGQRKVKRKGKTVCVRKKHKKNKQHSRKQAGTNGRAGR
jgi:hypothetical protein